MRPRLFPVLSAFLLIAACAVSPANADVKDWLNGKLKKPSSSASLDPETVATALRQALEQGTRRAVQDLGRENGFWSHPQLRIPVPEKLGKVDRGLRRIGQNKVADDFVRSLNRAAEQATPVARDIFVSAVRKMTVRDALDILHGSNDAATQYFRRQTEMSLTSAFKPIVARSTEAVGVTASYKRFVKRAEPLGLVDTRNLDIDDYVTSKAMDGLFFMIAEEETRIRKDPVARTTELLRRVFDKQ